MAAPELQHAALEELIAGLNPAQREAVQHLEGPLLIFAGAGSGKTRVLTTRIANLVAQRKVWPDRLLAVTFTDKAARDRWRDRFRHVLVDEYQDTNHAQYVLVNLVAGEHHNLAVVGDDDQCLVAGTRVTMGDGTARPIEELAPGDLVLSGYGSGEFRPARVLRVHRSRARGLGVALTTRAGRRLVSALE